MLMLNLTAYTCNMQKASFLFSKQGFFFMMFEWKTCGFYFTEGGGKLRHSLPKAGWISPHRQALRYVNAVGFWLKNRPAWTVHWMKWFIILQGENLVRFCFISCLKKKILVSEHHASSRGHHLLTRLFLSKRSCSCQSPRHPRSVFLPICKSKRQSCMGQVNRGSVQWRQALPGSCCAFLSPRDHRWFRVQCHSLYSFAFILLNEAILIQKQRC